MTRQELERATKYLDEKNPTVNTEQDTPAGRGYYYGAIDLIEALGYFVYHKNDGTHSII